MIKIAVLNSGNSDNRKGAFNNVQERINHLRRVDNICVDPYLLQYMDSWFFKLLRKNDRERTIHSKVDDVNYSNIWVTHKFIDYLATYVLKVKGLSCKSQLSQFVDIFSEYDLLSVHALPDMYIAYLVKKKYGIPFVTTWHGSDINVAPFNNKKTRDLTKMIIEETDFNFFVSKKLMEVSNFITSKGNKDYLYTGPSDKFKRISNTEKQEIKRRYNISSQYVIGFIGNLVPIKNVMVLPDIFENIAKRLTDVSFVVVGNGELRNRLEYSFNEKGLIDVMFTGNVEPGIMPELIHTIDVLVLPSKNEGLPRVTLEARASGVHVVGSNVGGIPEAIGLENSFALDRDFVENISNRIIEILSNNEPCPMLSNDFSWNTALKKEISIYDELLGL